MKEESPVCCHRKSGMLIMLGGPMYKIKVDEKIYEFEMHPYCGPTILNSHGNPAALQPHRFLEAASLWAQQGQRMELELCRWDREPNEILKHLGGKNWKIVGYKNPVKGE